MLVPVLCRQEPWTGGEAAGRWEGQAWSLAKQTLEVRQQTVLLL